MSGAHQERCGAIAFTGDSMRDALLAKVKKMATAAALLAAELESQQYAARARRSVVRPWVDAFLASCTSSGATATA